MERIIFERMCQSGIFMMIVKHLVLLLFCLVLVSYSDGDSGSKQRSKSCTYMCSADFNLTDKSSYHLHYMNSSVPMDRRIQVLFSRIKRGTCTFVTKFRGQVTLIVNIKCADKRRGPFNIEESDMQRLIPRHPARPLYTGRHDRLTSTGKPSSNPNCRQICIGNRTSIFTDPKILELSIERMSRALRLNKRNLTVFRTRKGCVEDHRMTSKVMGGVGIVVIVCTALVVLAADFHTFVITRKMSIRPQNNKHSSKNG